MPEFGAQYTGKASNWCSSARVIALSWESPRGFFIADSRRYVANPTPMRNDFHTICVIVPSRIQRTQVAAPT